ncbi:MAG: glycosyltransferase family 4 protein [Ilumatobacteraceae bacterium]
MTSTLGGLIPSRRILIISTPVGPLGSGTGGGVELTLHSMVLGLSGRGHQVEVLAPEGSLHVGGVTHQIAGALQPSTHVADRDTMVTLPSDGVLSAMCEWARVHQDDFDVILNLAYDWLPFYLTPFFTAAPLAHLVSMATLTDAMDDAIIRAAALRPRNVAMHSQAQADTFPALARDVPIIGNGIAVERYDMHMTADEPPYLGFVGRISPEKGLDDVFAAAAASGLPLKVWGLMQDRGVWDSAVAAHPGARVTYEGFLPTDELQAAIGGCAAVVMAPKWVEAFGNVALEAMATGVPVIAYRRGGPAEIIADGKTGFLVEPDDVDGLIAAIARIGELDRVECRQRVEEQYSIPALSARVEQWLDAVIECHRTSWHTNRA